MKLGDLVKWIGFPGATHVIEEKYGIIIKKIYMHNPDNTDRINVLWACGTVGKGLYQETVEVVNDDSKNNK